MGVELGKISLGNDANLQKYYRFEGNSNDEIASDNGSDTLITYSIANGKFAQGAGFGGSSYIDLTGKSPTGARSYSFWVKSSSASLQTIIDETRGNGNNDGNLIQLLATGELRWIIGKSGGGILTLISSDNTLENGVYRHIVLTWDGTTGADGAKVYVDGQEDNTGTVSSATENTPLDPIRFGAITSSVATTLSGALDDFAVFDRELTADEALKIYKGLLQVGKPMFFDRGMAIA